MKIRPIRYMDAPVRMELPGSQKWTSFSKEMSYGELESLHRDIADRIVAAVHDRIMYGNAENTEEERKLFEVESIMQYLDNWKSVDMPISMPPPQVESISHHPDTGYTVNVKMHLPVIPDIGEIEGWFASGVLSNEGDIVDIQGESFVCTEVGTSRYSTPLADDEGIRGPTGSLGAPGPIGHPGATGVPGIPAQPEYTSGLLYGPSTKPLMYSVDVYKSLKDSEFVAVSSFPVKNTLSNGNVPVGSKVKPYAVGRTIQEATGRLAESVKAWAGRKEVSVINEHMMIDRWACIHCSGSVTSYTSKQDLLNHMTYNHGGNLSVDRYTHPVAASTWLKLP